jgi:hypothetical protein
VHGPLRRGINASRRFKALAIIGPWSWPSNDNATGHPAIRDRRRAELVTPIPKLCDHCPIATALTSIGAVHCVPLSHA